MVALTVPVETISRRRPQTVTTISMFNKTRAEYHSGHTVDRDKTKNYPVRIWHHGMKSCRGQLFNLNISTRKDFHTVMFIVPHDVLTICFASTAMNVIVFFTALHGSIEVVRSIAKGQKEGYLFTVSITVLKYF